MKYIIIEMKNDYTFINEQKKIVSYKGYAFIDEWGHCIIIVYGESKRDLIKKYLSETLL